MGNYLAHAATVFMGFFAIMNPIANVPIFLSLTADDERDVERKVALRAVGTAFLVVLVFCTAGKIIFDLFGITLPAFRITGGILVFLIGFHMLQGKPSRFQNPSKSDTAASREAELNVAVVPLGVPILAGPGTIATAMSFSVAGGLYEFFTTIGAFFVLCLLTYWLFRSGERLVTYLGENGVKVVTRMMGLILAVIGTQLVIAGVEGVVQLLLKTKV